MEPSSLLFVLGIQRSGTTWLANIFDASPDTLLFMEPFAPAIDLFPEIPEPGAFLESAPPEVTRLLSDRMCERLYHSKFLFSPRSLRDPIYFRFERGLSRLANRIRPYAPLWIHRQASRFNEVNLNRLEASYPIYPKSDDPAHWVVKELRLAGKVDLLQSAFPDARYLVAMRSPHATVHSILRWFSRGRLGQVRQLLDVFVEMLEAQKIGSRYERQIAIARRGGIAHRAALYWRVCYETIVSRLDGDQAFRLLPYEGLAADPLDTAKELYDWLGTSMPDVVADYIRYSSNMDVKNPAATNTVRQSEIYYLSWQDEITPETRQAVDDIVDGSFLLEYVRPYYER